jgi:hypothetical protein
MIASDAAKAASLYAAYQETTSAIAVLDAGGTGISVTLTDANGAQYQCGMAWPGTTLRALLVAQQASIKTALTQLGVTLP